MFDACFIFGTLVLALVMGAFASLSSGMLLAVVFVDSWIFAKPHIIATYTRIACRQAEIKRHWFLIFLLPSIVLVTVTAVALAYEVAGLFTVYFVTQTYHVARQSFGIARSYKRIENRDSCPDRLSEVLIYLFPLWGLLNRCSEAHANFLGYPLTLPCVPPVVVGAVSLVTIFFSIWWILRQWRYAHAGQVNPRHAWFVASHFCVSLVAYVWISEITLGWVVVNTWHNIQYLFFVWLQNIRRERQWQAERVVDSVAAPEILKLVAPWKGAVRYMLLCLIGGAVLYQGVDMLGRQFLWLGLPTVLIAHFTLNFHHYLVDGVIWRRRKPERGVQV